MLGPFQTWNIMSFQPSILVDELNTAVDSDVGYNGAEFNSVCCSQSLQFFLLSNMIRVSTINALYLAHVKCDF